MIDRLIKKRLFLTVVALFVAAGLLFVGRMGAQETGRPSVGLTPLTDLGEGYYAGYQGGLYPGGQNERPFDHDATGKAIAQTIRPLAPDGTIDDENGKIGFVAIGMSNTSMEFETFAEKAGDSPQLNPHLVLVDGAQHGKASQFVANPRDEYWTVLDQRLAAAGLSDSQVQIAWLKEARARTNMPFPLDAMLLKRDLKTIVHLLTERFPNLKIIYLSSRTYGGYATVDLNPEPYAYQSGFAVKWLIADQIEGDPSLNYDPDTGDVRAPWLAWRPYLWADGVRPRSDGITWQEHQFSYDGTHPSPAGEAKVAGLLYHFLRTDKTAVPWFLSE